MKAQELQILILPSFFSENIANTNEKGNNLNYQNQHWSQSTQKS